MILGLNLLLGAAPAGPQAADAKLPLTWKDGLVERNFYVITEDGTKTGEIEQVLYGVTQEGQQYFRAVFEVVRNTNDPTLQPVIGRSTMEVVFDPESLDLVERTDHYSIFGNEGRIRTLRTPGGLRVLSESQAEGIQRNPQEKTFSHSGDEPLIDQMLYVYLVRSLEMESGNAVRFTTVLPLEQVMHTSSALVGPVQSIDWGGKETDVRRIDVSTPKGITVYYISPEAPYTLIRYVAPQQETYELKPPAAE